VNPNKRRPDGDSTIIERAATAAKNMSKSWHNMEKQQ